MHAYDMQKDTLEIAFRNFGTIVASWCQKIANVLQQRERSVVKGALSVLVFLPEQLRVDEGDDILQDLERWANQKVGPKGFDKGT